MLTISKEQIRVMAEAQVVEFIRQSMISLRTGLPDETRRFDDDALRNEVNDIVEQLRQIGFERMGDLRRALHMLFVLKHGVRRRVVPPHIAMQFRDPGASVQTRIEALEQVFIFGHAAPLHRSPP